ncbi:reverse transcriptase domain-containing protein [Tanacetum coccineum]
MDLKTHLETVAKNHQASIQNLKTKFDRLTDKQSGRPSGSLPSNTQPNQRGSNSKAYQPSQAHNKHVNAIFTRSGKSFNPPDNPNDQQNKPENPINFDSDDEDDEPTPQPKTQPTKPVKETPFPKPYKPNIPLADRSFQYLVEISENIFVEVGKFTFPVDFVILEMEEDNKVPLILGRPFLHTADAVIRVKQKQLNLGVVTERMIFNIDFAMKHSYSNDDTCFSIDEILEEDFDPLLEEGSKILHSVEGTLLKEEIFSEFDEFVAMTADENSKSESDTEEPSFEKITINTDYKIKTSLEEPPTDLKLKLLPNNLEYVFLEEPSFLPIQLMDDKKLVVQKQRRLNPNMQEVVKNEIVKLLDTDIIYPIADSPWVSLIHRVPKKGGITVVTNENDELVPTRIVTGWREKCHFMVKEGIVLGHKVSSAGLEVDKVKINVISKLPSPTNIKGVRSFLGHADFYQRFIKDFSKIIRPLTNLLEKYTPFEFNDECQKAFESLKEKLICAHVIISPNWNLPFELMCDASDFAVGVVLGQKDGKNFHPIYFASKTLNPAQQKYTKLFCQFGMPKALISDQGTHFCNKIMENTMKRYRVNHCFSTSYHPKTSGQVKNTNRALKRILEKTIKDNPAIWSRKLDDALWAFRTD